MNKFLIIGSANAIAYKEIFPYIASGEWFVRSANGKISFTMRFTTSDGEERNVPSLWYTNLDSRHLYKTLELTKTYDLEKYPKYDNYDAIEVSRLKDIPYDYNGVMGVPISIVLFSPTQFEIVGCPSANNVPEGWRGMTKEFVDLYYAQGGTGQYQEGNILESIIKDGRAYAPYKRILIRRKKNELI